MTTNGPSTTRLSVRGHAQRTVPPDYATIFANLTVTASTTSDASAGVAEAVAAMIAELGGLGGAALNADNAREPLTWSRQSVRTEPEYAPDEHSAMHGPTGRHRAIVDVLVAVRDMSLVDRVAAALARHEQVEIHSVRWSVDDDNPAWPLVRADAIRAALAKGEDYAAALGGTVTHVEQVADAGLLADERATSFAHAGAVHEMGGPPEISLDPVPQRLTATIDARLAATVGPLPTR